jgi:hypothetical protein
MGIFNFRAAGEIIFGAGSVGDAGAIIRGKSGWPKTSESHSV